MEISQKFFLALGVNGFQICSEKKFSRAKAQGPPEVPLSMPRRGFRGGQFGQFLGPPEGPSEPKIRPPNWGYIEASRSLADRGL